MAALPRYASEQTTNKHNTMIAAAIKQTLGAIIRKM
jgi:hypothetical protein